MEISVFYRCSHAHWPGQGPWQVSAEEGQIPETQSADIYEEVINCGENDEWLGIKHEDQTMTVVGRRHLDWAEDKTIEIRQRLRDLK